MAKDLVKTLADLKEQEVIKIVEDRLKAKEDPLKILDDARRGMETVGTRFSKSEYFVPDLVYSGEILENQRDGQAEAEQSGEIKRGGKVISARWPGISMTSARTSSSLCSMSAASRYSTSALMSPCRSSSIR